MENVSIKQILILGKEKVICILCTNGAWNVLGPSRNRIDEGSIVHKIRSLMSLDYVLALS